MDIIGERTFVGHLTLNAFGNQFLHIRDIALTVAVAAPLSHGADGSHAAVYLVGPALIQDRFSGAFFGAREETADHNGISAGSHGLSDIAGELYPSVRDDRHVVTGRRLGATAD